MGIRIQVGNYTLQASDYSVEESSTPLAAGDSSGGVGSISFTVPQPDPDATGGTPSTGYGPWITRRINIAPDPRARLLGAWSTQGGAQTLPLVSNTDPDGTRWVKSERIGTGNSRLIGMSTGANFSPNTEYRIRARVRASVAVSIAVSIRPSSVGSTVGAVTFATVAVPAGESVIDVTGTTTATAVGASAGVAFVSTTGAVGSIFEMTEVSWELASTSDPARPYFDGTMAASDTERYAWTGAVNASPSVYQNRTSFVTGYSLADNAWHHINEFGPDILLDLPVTLTDSRKGFTLGTVQGASRADDQGTIQISCSSKLADINAYGIQADPFVGTLEQAFEYYLGLANITTGLFVDDSIAPRTVVFPGWTGELWYHLKQMAIAQDCDISLVSGVVLLRPIRARIATRGRDISRSRDLSQQALAQSVEVYHYSNRPITNELVYPAGGWSPEVDVMNVNAGETSEYVWELSASVSSIQAPVMQTFVAEGYSASSVYTIVANDGVPVPPDAWESYGGSLVVSIEPDTRHLRVILRGATGLPTREGGPATQFSVALASDATGNRYSTLRIVGTGVAFNRVKKRIRTGVPASRTATEVGVTIDNPFISTVDDLYRAGTRAAKQYAGQVPNLAGSVVAINRRGDTGQAQYPTYDEVQAALYTELGAPDYSEVQTHYTTTLSLTTYESVGAYWFDFVRDDFTNQVFGNINGARVYDRKSRRWYRIRQGTATADRVTFSADDDLTHGDIEDFYSSKTYGDVELILSGLTYKQADLVGLYGN